MNRGARIRNFQKLDKLVKEQAITYYKLAGDLGLSKTLFSDWKSGKSMPKTDKLLKIANYFGVTVDYFLEE